MQSNLITARREVIIRVIASRGARRGTPVFEMRARAYVQILTAHAQSDLHIRPTFASCDVRHARC
jgi:hypothetical protein